MPEAEETPQTVGVIVFGRVQGVGFRAWTVMQATQLGLDGWVRNRRDGSVETVICGESVAVLRMLQYLRQGPPGSLVDDLQTFKDVEVPAKGFSQRPTV